MKIIGIYPMQGDERRASTCLARFNLQLTPDVRILGLRLVATGDGLKIHQPSINGGGRSATFSPELCEKIKALAATEYEAHIGPINISRAA